MYLLKYNFTNGLYIIILLFKMKYKLYETDIIIIESYDSNNFNISLYLFLMED